MCAWILCFGLVCMAGSVRAAHPAAELTLSSFLGGSGEDTARDVFVDDAGFIYVTGGTASSNFPTTAGAYDRTLNTSGSPIHDVFVTKLSPSGNIVWSTLLGGPNYDRAYAIEVDQAGFVYVGGRAGAGFPTTSGVLQTNFAGDVNPNSRYGRQDGFVAKLSPDGSSLIWATYFGDDDRSFIRDFDIDSQGFVYLVLTDGARTNSHVTAGAFQTIPGGSKDGVIAKLSTDASQVIWASYLGGSGIDVGTPSIRVNTAGQPHVLGYTNSSNMPTTNGAYNRTYNGGNGDVHLAKFSADGSQLLYGTFLGGSAVEFTETHGLALDSSGNAIVAVTTKSTNFPTTNGAFQRTYGGTGGSGTGSGTNYNGDGFIAKISADGSTLMAATYLGGRYGDGLEGVSVAGDGTIVVSGATFSDDFPVTGDAFQPLNMGNGDFFVVRMTSDLQRMVYGTLIGGSSVDFGRSSTTDDNGNIFAIGHTKSNDWPTLNAVQSQKAGGIDVVFTVLGSLNPCVKAGDVCDDGDACTEFDTCDDVGICAGTPLLDCMLCVSDADCDDALSCTNDMCIAGKCHNVGTCLDDGDPCNGQELCDPLIGACRSTGNPCPGVCDALLGCPCQTPIVSAAGSRYIKIEPLPVDSNQPVRIFVQSDTFPCIGKYVGVPTPIDLNHDFIDDGTVAVLVDNPQDAAELTPIQWGLALYVTGPDIIPSDASPSVYRIRAECGYVSADATTTMRKWGDTDGNGIDSAADILAVVKGFQLEYGPQASWTLVSDDVTGSLLCSPDGFLTSADILRIVQAFQGADYLGELAADVPNCQLPCQ